MPAIIGGDIGVYIKWALVLQEQLAHVQGERASLAQQVMSLKQDNQTLREALEKGVSSAVPASAALDAAAAGSAEASEVPDTSVSDRALRSSGPPAAAEAKPEPPIRSGDGDSAGGSTRRSARAPANPFCPPPKEEVPMSFSTPAPEGTPPPASPAAAAVAAAAAAAGKRGLPGTPPLDPFSSPNLRYLASFLDQPGQNGQGELFGDEAKPPAKLQRVANTSKTMNRFDRLAATRA